MTFPSGVCALRRKGMPAAGGRRPGSSRRPSPRALRPLLPVCFCSPALGGHYNLSENPFLLHSCPAQAGQESATAGESARTHLHGVCRQNSTSQALPNLAAATLNALFGNEPGRCSPVRRGRSLRRNQGGRGELFPPAGSGAAPRMLRPGPLLFLFLIPLLNAKGRLREGVAPRVHPRSGRQMSQPMGIRDSLGKTVSRSSMMISTSRKGSRFLTRAGSLRLPMPHTT